MMLAECRASKVKVKFRPEKHEFIVKFDRTAPTHPKGLAENQKKIVLLIIQNQRISKRELAKKLGISTTAIDKNITTLKKKKIIKRIGPDKGGHWEIKEGKHES